MDLDLEEYHGICTVVTAVCVHGSEHLLTARHSVSHDGVEPCWLGALFSRDKGADDPVLYRTDSKVEVIADGLQRLRDGGCACLKSALHHQVVAQRARYQAALAEDAKAVWGLD